MQTFLLGEIDKRPNLVHVHGRWYLNGNMLATFQCCFSYEEMVNPVGGDIYHVDVLTFTQFQVSVFARVDVCGGHTCIAKILLASLCTLLLIVAECHDLNTRNVSPTFYGTWSTHTQTHESHANNVEFGSYQSQNRLLSWLSVRYVCYDGSVLNLVRPIKCSCFWLLCECYLWQ